MYKSDVIIVGAGPVGCVLANKITSELNLKCLIIEKRDHIAGNCFDEINKKGLLYHKYGPHYLRFKSKKIFKYLSEFTKWIPGEYIVKSVVDNKHYPFPINLDTLEMFFNTKFRNKKEAIQFIKKKQVKIKANNSENFILSKLGKEIYEKFYKNYTIKQWGIHPKKLSNKIAGRVPIRYNRNPYYVNEKMKFMPKKGFTHMFKKMTSNKKIKFCLNTDFFKIRDKIEFDQFLIYTGTPDKYFDYKYGKLDWRSLKFKFETFKKKKIQSCVQYNFPNNYKFTRKVEIKHVTKQKNPYTVISKEFPVDGGDPYYPIINNDNLNKFSKYKKLINKVEKKNIYFEGRLAQYQYFNTDEVIERAITLFNKLKKKYNLNKKTY
jgi:UDP-galactopyranose mutase|tara:strand:+ start:1348 stop:2478 length:1131 start_codon:yes stop_codon:yes gene_type:complete